MTVRRNGEEDEDARFKKCSCAHQRLGEEGM